MATIKFYLQSNNNPAGIYIRLREGRSIDAKAKSKYAINPHNWSKKKEQPINLKDEDFKKLNADLSNLKDKLLKHYNISINNCQIDSAWLKDFINPAKKAEAIPTKLVDYFDFYLKHKESSISKVSHTKYIVIKHLLERFEKHEKKVFQINGVNPDFTL